MKRLAFFSVIFFALAFWGRGQVNLVVNPSFEQLYSCPNNAGQIDSVIGWNILLGGGGGNPDLYNVCCTLPSECGVPTQSDYNTSQYPHSGNGYAGIDAANSAYPYNRREYIQNKLKNTLIINHSYCVTFYASLSDQCTAYVTPLGAYFDDGSVMTFSYMGIAYANLSHQIINPQIINNTQVLNDKINWMKISGFFTASSNNFEYITIGNFFPDSTSNIVITGGNPNNWGCYYYIDDVSVIDIDTHAKAGKDILIHPGDSTFIGRPSEVGLDEDCIWFVNGIPIDTIAGFWVKPDTTTTYVLQQTICGNIKYDTITVTVSGVGVQEYNTGNNWVHLFPNPATTQINIETNSAISEIIITDISGKTILKQTVNN